VDAMHGLVAKDALLTNRLTFRLQLASDWHKINVGQIREIRLSSSYPPQCIFQGGSNKREFTHNCLMAVSGLPFIEHDKFQPAIVLNKLWKQWWWHLFKLKMWTYMVTVLFCTSCSDVTCTI